MQESTNVWIDGAVGELEYGGQWQAMILNRAGARRALLTYDDAEKITPKRPWRPSTVQSRTFSQACFFHSLFLGILSVTAMLPS